MSELEEIKCRHCGDTFPKDHLLNGLCEKCYSDREDDFKIEDKIDRAEYQRMQDEYGYELYPN